MNKGYEKNYEKKDYEKSYEKSYERANYRRIKYKDWCSIKLIPFMSRTVDTEKKEKDIFLLLGLDSKYKEWAPFGGTCHELYGSCKSQTKEQLLKCLSRELKEESRELLDLKSGFNLEECKKIHAVYDLPVKYDTITVLHENFYFVNWKEFEDEKIFDKLKSEFSDEKRNKEIERKFENDRMKLKSYFEMSDIDLVPLSKFHDMILNTIEDIYLNEKDKIIKDKFQLLFEKYISNGKLKVKSKLKSRLWGRFLYYLISGLNPEGKYSDINEFIKDFRSLLESKGCVK